jgi:hypothetical protein
MYILAPLSLKTYHGVTLRFGRHLYSVLRAYATLYRQREQY